MPFFELQIYGLIYLSLEDLDQIAEYIAGENLAAASKVVGKLWTAVQTLADQPHTGRPGRVFGTRELVVANTPLIVPYRVVNTEIQILLVLHGARKWLQQL